jgi:antitoxin (DNA-binding transcriptional repressor) of toxin-antitoxin stability system
MSTRVLKDQLSSYLQRAEAGEQIVALRDGRPVAALVPLSQLQAKYEQARLVKMASCGLITLPRRTSRRAFRGPRFQAGAGWPDLPAFALASEGLAAPGR